jgi:hypothetical protein
VQWLEDVPREEEVAGLNPAGHVAVKNAARGIFFSGFFVSTFAELPSAR